MSRKYTPGEFVGNFQIIEKIGSFLETNGDRQGLYSVRCRTCGKILHMGAASIRTKKDCGCSRSKGKYSAAKRRAIKRKKEPWMTDSEIYNHWKGLRDQDIGYSILAELNDVPVDTIIEIIHRQEELQN